MLHIKGHQEMQIKPAVRYPHMTVKMAPIWNTDNAKHWWGCRAAGTLTHYWQECKWYSHFEGQFGWFFSMKQNVLLPYDPAVMLLGIDLKELQTCPHVHTVFLAGLPCGQQLSHSRMDFLIFREVAIRSDQISHSVVSDSLRPHELQHARPPCPSPTPGTV